MATVFDSPPTSADSNKRNGRKRIRSFTADERACHRVIEKQRREALNESFLDLARLIPALASTRKLSKSLIVHESIKHLRTQRDMCLKAANGIQNIMAENLELVAELNDWRSQYGQPGMVQLEANGVSEAISALLRLEQEPFGTFPGGFGANAQGDDLDEEQGPENFGPGPVDGDKNLAFPDLWREAEHHNPRGRRAAPDGNGSGYLSRLPQVPAESVTASVSHGNTSSSGFGMLSMVPEEHLAIPQGESLLVLNDYDIPLPPYCETAACNSLVDLNILPDDYNNFNIPLTQTDGYIMPAVERHHPGYNPREPNSESSIPYHYGYSSR